MSFLEKHRGNEYHPLAEWRTGKPLPRALALALVACASNLSAASAASANGGSCQTAPVEYESLIVRYPATIVVDGHLDDDAWLDPAVVWHHVSSDHGFLPATSDADLSFEFAAVADEQHLYVGIRVTDDELHFDVGDYPQFDDSVDLFCDLGNEQNHSDMYPTDNWKNPGYDRNDSRFTATVDGRVFASTAMNPLLTPEMLQASPAVFTPEGYSMEFALPLSIPDSVTIQPHDGLTIGFDVSINDDDGALGVPPNLRKASIQWSNKAKVRDSEWTDPSLFGEAIFCAF